jgi:hypothetical protein
MEQDTLLMLLRFDEVEEINASSDKEAIEIFSDIMILKEEQ